jgi:biotin transport system substrate-specific component
MTTTAAPRATAPSTLADLLPAWRASPLVRDLVLVVAAAALTAGAAQVSFRMPWTPEVPYTLQTGAVLLSGTALGSRRGLLAIALYLAAGAVGLPVFSAGASGMAQFIGATGGYLVGFVIAAWLVGRLAERRWDRSVRYSAALMILGTLVIYLVGVPVLASVTGLPISDAIWRGAAVFVPWDLAKVALAAVLLPRAWRLAHG